MAACRERHPAADVRQGVAEELPWTDGSFDATLSCLVLQHLLEGRRRANSAGRGSRRATAPIASAERDVEDGELEASADYVSFEDFWEPLTFAVGPAGHYLASLSTERSRCSRCTKRLWSAGQVLIMDRRRQRDVRRIRTDPDALEAFYREHVDAVQRFVARRVACPELAADLTADIFVAAVESAERYRADRGAPSAWLYGIARHVVWAEFRRAGRERSAPVIAGSALLDGEDVGDILARIDAAASARELYRAMDALSESERAVLELVAVDQLPVTEAADALGIGKVTARVRLHRARRRMKEQLATPDTRQPAEAAP